MSCWTAYLVRDADGLAWAYGEKYGAWRLVDDGAREAVIHTCRTRGGRADVPDAARFIGGWYCRGVAIDVAARRARFHACVLDHHRPAVGFVESAVRRVAAAPAWAGWEVAYAHGGRDDLAAAIPSAAGAVAPAPAELPALAELTPVEQGDWIVGWDPSTRELAVRYLPWTHYGALISVIAPDLTVTDHAIDDAAHHGVARWLTFGDRLLAALAPRIPDPLLGEGEIDDGAVIDHPARRIRYWTARPVPHAVAAALGAAWPGWTVERLPFGLAGHLAATGREPAPELVPDDELRAPDRWGVRWFDDGWLAARRRVARDPRPLRPVTVRYVDDA